MKVWKNAECMTSKGYTCNYCGKDISSEKGYYCYRDDEIGSPKVGRIYICHHCLKPTFFDEKNIQSPGALYGKAFDESAAPTDIIELYNEARRCMSVSAYSSVGMCCRKLLMHIAVEKGASDGLKFAQYVNYLDENHYIGKESKVWVDSIREKGNEANHEIKLLSYEEAIQLIEFVEILITTIYEIPFRMMSKV